MRLYLNRDSKEYIPFLVVILSLLLGLFADIRPVNFALSYGGYVGEGAMSILYPAIIVSIVVFAFLSLRTKLFDSCSKWSFIIPIYLIVFYWITSSFIGEPRINFLLFLSFTIAAFFLPNILRVNPQIMIKSMIIYPFFAIFRLETIFVLSWRDAISMDASYAFLIPICANIVYLRYYFMNENRLQQFITIVFTTINAVIFSFNLLYGSRGPLLCVFSLIVFIWLSQISEIGMRLNMRKFALVLIGGFFLIFFFYDILHLIEIALSSVGIHIRAIVKIIELGGEDNLSNGRDSLNSILIDLISMKPLFGYGLDRFEANTKEFYPYPHNFILQIFYDGGIWLALVLSPIFKNIKSKFKNADKDAFCLYTLLFFCSVPGALFSQDLWNIAILWLFFGTMISKNCIYKENI